MVEKTRIPEFSMTRARLRCWPPWPPFPWGDPMPDIYHLLDEVQQAKVIPVVIKHYEKLLEVQQKFSQGLFEIQRESLKELAGMLR